MQLPETRYARTEDGLDIAYQVFGQGPDLVFVHRFVGTIGYMWDVPPVAAFLSRLGDVCRVFALDPRGSGLSDRLLPASVLALEARVFDLVAILDAEGLAHPSFLGSEDGGSLCALFAASHPGRVDRLILHNTEACGHQAPDYPFGFTAEGWNELIEEALRSWGTDWIDGQVRDIAPSVAGDPDVLRRIVNLYRLGASPRNAAEVFAIQRDLDIRSILPSIQAPTLVLDPLNVAEDVSGSPGAARYLAERIPGARLVPLPGADYEIYSGNPDGVLAEIEVFLTGTHRSPDTNRVLATVLFTDIVGSTALAAELGDARWKERLAAHDRVVAAEVERFRGRLVRSTGDGVQATFDGPARAVRCAHAIAERARAMGVEIRAGAHTGEIELVDDHVEGIAVHIGARVAALAGPGEVWASSTVKDLTAGSGLTFEDRGEHELKGVPDRWHLYRVTG